ncbi:hypothetical protein [Deinococcus multiflagellatus]|uniref:Uncharacterized protein n=1 Tax=Deinococcus multiflagellatus TaxID=1656887 RepID=A0ABW1ZFI7_9DEIO
MSPTPSASSAQRAPSGPDDQPRVTVQVVNLLPVAFAVIGVLLALSFSGRWRRRCWPSPWP